MNGLGAGFDDIIDLRGGGGGGYFEGDTHHAGSPSIEEMASAVAQAYQHFRVSDAKGGDLMAGIEHQVTVALTDFTNDMDSFLFSPIPPIVNDMIITDG
ncbi:hypothetical protein HK102_005812, partial [Quaeritorhiza haematococci]